MILNTKGFNLLKVTLNEVENRFKFKSCNRQ